MKQRTLLISLFVGYFSFCTYVIVRQPKFERSQPVDEVVGVVAQCSEVELKELGLLVRPWPQTNIWVIANGCNVTPAYKDSVEGVVVRDYRAAISALSKYRQTSTSPKKDSVYTHLMTELLLWEEPGTKKI